MRDAAHARLPDRRGDVLRHVRDAPEGPRTTSTSARTSRARCAAPTRSTRRCSTAAGDDPDFHVKSFECLGACDIAPMASVDGEYVGPLEEDDCAQIVEDVKAGRPVLEAKQLRHRKAAGEPATVSLETCSSSTTSTSPGCNTLEVYRRERGGYEMLERALDMEPGDVLAELQASGLRGRGGAGFAMGTKASFMPKGDMDKYVVCNADESEPGTFKDRELMQKNPHLLIEGICDRRARGRARTRRSSSSAASTTCRPRSSRRRSRRPRPRTCSATLDLWVHRGAGAYICGEETALLDALEGKRGNPRLKPPFPAVQGLYQRPDADQQRRDADERPADPADGRRGVRQDRHGALDGHQGRLGLGLRPAAGQLRDRARHPLARASSTASPAARRRAARSSSGSPAARARRCSRARTSTSTCRTTSSRWPRPARCSARARSSSSTTRSRSSTSRSRRRSSTATSRAASARRAARARTGP